MGTATAMPDSAVKSGDDPDGLTEPEGVGEYRIEALRGRSLADPQVRVDAWVALQARRR